MAKILFGGIENQDFKKAKFLIIPVPFEATTSYIKGTKRGPEAISEASDQIEEIWGENFPSKIEKEKLIFTFDEIKLKGKPKKAILELYQFLKKIKKEKIPILIGGEHTITLAGVMAAKEKYKNLSVLQFDAHPDLRDEYEGEKFSHACVMRRIRELGIPITALGIRSIDCDVAEFIKREKIKNLFPKIEEKKILGTLSKNIYLTFDFDFLDPAIMPSVGNPQPGGFFWSETIDFLKKICQNKNIVAADFVEFCPIENFFAPNFLAAKLIYNLINFLIG
jgi:agmatinase